MAGETKALIDARTFQEPLEKLAHTMAEKVRREGAAYLPAPTHVADDLFVMLRQAVWTYKLLYYLNADERRNGDCYWDNSYGVVAAPLVRSMIDCLYNITMILQDPAKYGPAYRKAGLKKRLNDIEEDRATYAGKPEWYESTAEQLKALELLIRGSGYTLEDIRTANSWATLGTYLQPKAGQAPTSHQRFLKTFNHMAWRQYSAMSHCGYEGYIADLTPGAYYVMDTLPHEVRSKFDAQYADFVTRHLGRAALAGC